MANDEAFSWEITKEEYRKRYSRYLPVMIPAILTVDTSGLLALWMKDGLLWGGSILAIVHVGIILWLWRTYTTLPHRYQLTKDGISITMRSGSVLANWKDFAGYIVNQEYACTMDTQKAGIGQADMRTVVQASRTIFGTSYQLIRPWGRWAFRPFRGSICITAEPDVSGVVEKIITKNLKKISAEQFKRATNDTWVLLIASIIFILFLIYERLFR